MNRKAVVLLSGGMDSAACRYEARAAGYELYALTVNYGQRPTRIQAAQEIAAAAGAVRHIVYPMDLTLWGGSALTDGAIAIPTSGVDEETIPVTYVPARKHDAPLAGTQLGRGAGAEAIYIRREQPRLLGVSRLLTGVHCCLPGFDCRGDQGYHPRRPDLRRNPTPILEQDRDRQTGAGTWCTARTHVELLR